MGDEDHGIRTNVLIGWRRFQFVAVILFLSIVNRKQFYSQSEFLPTNVSVFAVRPLSGRALNSRKSQSCRRRPRLMKIQHRSYANLNSFGRLLLPHNLAVLLFDAQNRENHMQCRSNAEYTPTPSSIQVGMPQSVFDRCVGRHDIIQRGMEREKQSWLSFFRGMYERSFFNACGHKLGCSSFFSLIRFPAGIKDYCIAHT